MDNEEIIRELRERRDALIKWRASTDRETLKNAYVVLSRTGTALGFDIDGLQVVNPRPVALRDVTCFPVERAMNIAARCYDPDGVSCRIMNLGVLLDMRIADANSMLADYNQSAFTLKD